MDQLSRITLTLTLLSPSSHWDSVSAAFNSWASGRLRPHLQPLPGVRLSGAKWGISLLSLEPPWLINVLISHIWYLVVDSEATIFGPCRRLRLWGHWGRSETLLVWVVQVLVLDLCPTGLGLGSLEGVEPHLLWPWSLRGPGSEEATFDVEDIYLEDLSRRSIFHYSKKFDFRCSFNIVMSLMSFSINFDIEHDWFPKTVNFVWIRSVLVY